MSDDLLRAVDALLDQVRRERVQIESRLESLSREEEMLKTRRHLIAMDKAEQIISDVAVRTSQPHEYSHTGARGVIKKAITDVIKAQPGLTPSDIADRLEQIGIPIRGSSYRQTVYNALGPMRENAEVALRDGRYYPA